MKKIHLKISLAIIILLFSNIAYCSIVKYKSTKDLQNSLIQDFNTYNPYLEEQKELDNVDKNNTQKLVKNDLKSIIKEQKDILDTNTSSWIINTNTWKIISNIWVISKNTISKSDTQKQVVTPQKETKVYWIYEDDSSIKKYISNKISFNNLKYIPSDLVKISWDYLLDVKWWQKLRKEALENLDNLSKDFYLNFQVKLKIVSAYRSYEYQKWIIDRWCSLAFCAKAGYSEHQSWLAVDIFEATSQKEFLSKPDLEKYFLWMQENAYKYWFHNSYQNWVEIDGYNIEPWHWRYLWVDLATTLYENNETFAIYYKNIK